MKVYDITNVEEFLKKVEECKGTVELVSGEGDRLNLKSQLTKYIALAQIFGEDSKIKEMDLVMSEPEDAIKIMHYLMQRP